MARDLASTTGVAGRYAAALFDLADEAGALETVEGELKEFAAAIAGSEDLSGFIKSPAYDRADQMQALAAIAEKANLSVLTTNFLKLVASNRRLFALPSMIAAFVALAARRRGEVSAEAVSASLMNEEQVKALNLEIERQIGKAVNLATRVDPDLLGGLVVTVGSRMIDTSLRTKLNRLRTVMKEA